MMRSCQLNRKRLDIVLPDDFTEEDLENQLPLHILFLEPLSTATPYDHTPASPIE